MYSEGDSLVRIFSLYLESNASEDYYRTIQHPKFSWSVADVSYIDMESECLSKL